MADNRSPQARSKNMSHIHSKDTKPEETVRRFLFSRGFRYRKNDRRYPGKPDIVLPKFQTVVFVHGCFWHGHTNCSYFVIPKSNIDFWKQKLKYNQERDSVNIDKLQAAGWHVIVVWECELRTKNREARLESLVNEIHECRP